MRERNAALLVLVVLGFLILYWNTRDTIVLAVGCWVLAGVYAWITHPGRML